MQAEARLKEMGIKLPPAVTPVANYVPAVRTGNLVFLSGHGPFKEDGSLITGKVGSELTAEQGYEAARRVAVGLLGSLKAEIGDLEKVKRVVKVLGLVNCPSDFTNQPQGHQRCFGFSGGSFRRQGQTRTFGRGDKRTADEYRR